MADGQPHPTQPDFGTPADVTEPQGQHPADQHSFVLQGVFELRQGFGRIEERTNYLRQDIQDLRSDVRDKVGGQAFWSGIAIIIAVLLTFGVLIYNKIPDQPSPQAASPTLPSTSTKGPTEQAVKAASDS